MASPCDSDSSALCSALEAEYAPRLGIAGVLCLCCLAARVLVDDASPERQSTEVRLGNANCPLTRQATPEQPCSAAAHAGAAQTAQDEELGDVQNFRAFTDGRAAPGQDEPRQFAAASDQEREAPFRLGPIERQPMIAEA